MEFCIRLWSTEKRAVDIFDGRNFITDFSYMIVRRPDVLHKNQIAGEREALSLYYDKRLIPAFESAGINLSHPGWKIQIDERIVEIISQLREWAAMSQVDGIVECLDIGAFQLVAELWLRSCKISEDGIQERKVKLIASYLRMHYREKIDIDKLLIKNGFSRRSFFSLVEEVLQRGASGLRS